MLKDKMPYNGLPKPRVELLEQLLARSTWPLRLARLFGVPNRTRVRTHRIRVSVGLGSSTLRLGFAADFHTGPSTDPAAITTACEALARANVHALLLGGDFVGARADYFEELAPQLAAIPAPLGKFAVLGNHDYWTGAEQVRAGLRALGCHVLENANVRLPEPFDSVWICGLDDDWTGRPDGR
ncbi:MAG TPA: metallophosphoesterase, partial [Candidatus Polarisedimenticolia bacterium]|nr:metallophosphoesterase [Candidatus Polarisedimenticolia bacterium]